MPSHPPQASSSIDPARLIELLERMATRTIAVIGDVMLDRYLVGETERLSPEAPVPVVKVRASRNSLGGAANVGANVASIGASCALVGIVGDDAAGTEIRTDLSEAGLDSSGIVVSSDRPTTTKTRVIARGQQVVRIDEEEDDFVTGHEARDLLARVEAALTRADALILEDYNKGTLFPALITHALGLARDRGIPVVVDPKFRQFFSFAGATVLKPNRAELEAALGADLDPADWQALPLTLSRLRVDNLLVTQGRDGMLLVGRNQPVVHIPSLAREVYDVSGAGDTVTAWVGTALAAGATVAEAAVLATYAAGVEVGKAGVATVTPSEVLAIYQTR